MTITSADGIQTDHEYLHTNPSLRRGFGFETLPAQSTFWRVWHTASVSHCVLLSASVSIQPTSDETVIAALHPVSAS
jgi:hypothetical protein